MRSTLSLSLVAVSLLAASLACSPLDLGISATVPPPSSPTATPFPPAIPLPPTDMPPTAAPEPSGLLPAPLYFISASDSQIWRVERDGVTATRVTAENAPVTYFDVSPASGDLVYVSNNDLLRSDPFGGSRVLLVDGMDLPAGNFDLRINNEISHPRWSPDGSQISYGHNGVNIIPAGDGQPQTLLQSDPVPDMGAGRPQTLPRFFLEGIWSPVGSQLLINYAHWPEGGGYAFYSPGSGALTEIAAPGIACCNPTWAADGQAVYFSNDSMGLLEPGLWRVNAATGQSEALITLPADGSLDHISLAAGAAQLSSGHLHYFYAESGLDPATGSIPWPSQLSMVRADADGVTNRTQLRPDVYGVGESLWAADGSGAVIWSISSDPNSYGHGPVLWLDAANNPAVQLAPGGSQFRWGK